MTTGGNGTTARRDIAAPDIAAPDIAAPDIAGKDTAGKDIGSTGTGPIQQKTAPRPANEQDDAPSRFFGGKNPKGE
jgi:hypothetical protein